MYNDTLIIQFLLSYVYIIYRGEGEEMAVLNTEKKNTLRVVRAVMNKVNISREGTRFGTIALPASVIREELKISEIEFVRVLNRIKTNYADIYKNMKIPPQWDGASHRFFPESYPSEEKILCEVLTPDLSPSLFYDLPSDMARRVWNIGDRVYVPIDHPETIRSLKDKKLRVID